MFIHWNKLLWWTESWKPRLFLLCKRRGRTIHVGRRGYDFATYHATCQWQTAHNPMTCRRLKSIAGSFERGYVFSKQWFARLSYVHSFKLLSHTGYVTTLIIFRVLQYCTLNMHTHTHKSSLLGAAKNYLCTDSQWPPYWKVKSFIDLLCEMPASCGSAKLLASLQSPRSLKSQQERSLSLPTSERSSEMIWFTASAIITHSSCGYPVQFLHCVSHDKSHPHHLLRKRNMMKKTGNRMVCMYINIYI